MTYNRKSIILFTFIRHQLQSTDMEKTQVNGFAGHNVTLNTAEKVIIIVICYVLQWF